tara:strand:+ start:126929 stop:127735 length:807 start_codon:yes stop_codon:yes gene_type:complete
LRLLDFWLESLARAAFLSLLFGWLLGQLTLPIWKRTFASCIAKERKNNWTQIDCFCLAGRFPISVSVTRFHPISFFKEIIVSSPHLPTRLFENMAPELLDQAEAAIVDLAGKEGIDLAFIASVREKAEVDPTSLNNDEWASLRLVSTAVGRLTFATATPDMIALTDENFEELALDPNDQMLVQFSTGWCGPCHHAAPILNEVAARGARVGKLDCGLATETAKRFAVRSYPNFLFFHRGRLTAIYRGQRTIEAIEEWLSEFEPVATAAN